MNICLLSLYEPTVPTNFHWSDEFCFAKRIGEKNRFALLNCSADINLKRPKNKARILPDLEVCVKKFTGLVRRCIEDYNMIEAGEHIAVGISGGKDSLALLCALSNLREYYPKEFSLSAITIDMGFDSMDFTAVKELCRRLRVPYKIIRTGIKTVVFGERNEKNPCSLCSKMRRGVLNEKIKEMGIKKVALGHHRDDAVETFFMSLIYESRLHCFQPVTYLDISGVTQIRPLLYATEKDVQYLTDKYRLPVVESTCPMNGQSKRQSIKELVEELSGRYPGLSDRVFGAMQKYPLKGFAPSRHTKQKAHGRSKLDLPQSGSLK